MVRGSFYPIRMLVLDLMWDSSKYIFFRSLFWRENQHESNDKSFLGDESPLFLLLHLFFQHGASFLGIFLF